MKESVTTEDVWEFMQELSQIISRKNDHYQDVVRFDSKYSDTPRGAASALKMATKALRYQIMVLEDQIEEVNTVLREVKGFQNTDIEPYEG